MICLDSDFMISLLRGDEEAKKKSKDLEKADREIVTTAVNVFELFVGIVAVDGIVNSILVVEKKGFG